MIKIKSENFEGVVEKGHVLKIGDPYICIESGFYLQVGETVEENSRRFKILYQIRGTEEKIEIAEIVIDFSKKEIG
ncbi:MAG: hypothetical protein O2U61_05265, partial [Candidatus Bathyarchaeota archaeon]|nr:hypothetical protein [Candidatus Bathyarchaeota archaeon]